MKEERDKVMRGVGKMKRDIETEKERERERQRQ